MSIDNNILQYYKEEWCKLELLQLEWKLTPEQRWDAIVLLLDEVKEKVSQTLDLYK